MPTGGRRCRSSMGAAMSGQLSDGAVALAPPRPVQGRWERPTPLAWKVIAPTFAVWLGLGIALLVMGEQHPADASTYAGIVLVLAASSLLLVMVCWQVFGLTPRGVRR